MPNNLGWHSLEYIAMVRHALILSCIMALLQSVTILSLDSLIKCIYMYLHAARYMRLLTITGILFSMCLINQHLTASCTCTLKFLSLSLSFLLLYSSCTMHKLLGDTATIYRCAQVISLILPSPDSAIIVL